MSCPLGTPFAIDVVAVGLEEVCVEVVGEVDLATSPWLAEVLEREISTGKTVVLDLSRVTFMDCAGLRAIRSAIRESRCTGNELKHALPLPPHICRLIELTGAHDIWPLSSNAASSSSPATTARVSGDHHHSRDNPG